MSWQAGQRTVAEVTGATVRGNSIAGGAQLQIDVGFRLIEWPWKENGPISLVPQPSQVSVRFAHRELNLGFAFPNPTCVVSPPSHSSTCQVHFTLSLTRAALLDIETARDGGSIALSMTLVAHPIRLVQHQGYAPGIEVVPTVEQRAFEVPKEQWLTVLKSVGYCETILIELRLPTTGSSAEHLARAVAARNEGRYNDAIAACRIAVERLDDAPKESSGELDRILKAKRADLSERDRFVLLRTAAQIFASPAHHGATHHQREDAELAIVVATALARLAPRWGTDAPPSDTSENAR